MFFKLKSLFLLKLFMSFFTSFSFGFFFQLTSELLIEWFDDGRLLLFYKLGTVFLKFIKESWSTCFHSHKIFEGKFVLYFDNDVKLFTQLSQRFFSFFTFFRYFSHLVFLKLLDLFDGVWWFFLKFKFDESVEINLVVVKILWISLHLFLKNSKIFS